MLATQISYWSLQETHRSNLVNERETQRHNTTVEKETERHNRATEEYNNNVLAETARHNKETERLTERQQNLNYNIAQNQQIVARAQLEISKRGVSNAEKQTQLDAQYKRSQLSYQALAQLQNYSLGLSANRVSQVNAETNRMNALTNEAQAAISANRAAVEATRVSVQNQADLQNAASNARNAATRTQELEQKKSEQKQKYSIEGQKLAQGYVNILVDVVKSGFNAASRASSY